MSSSPNRITKPSNGTALKRGWTTGACATAATKAAFTALITGHFPDPVSIILPRGDAPSFALAMEGLTEDEACAAIIKDAGDDPDVTHGALIISRVKWRQEGTGIKFIAGDGVGIVTKVGLPIAVSEAAINPVPRQLMTQVIEALASEYNVSTNVEITISIPDGEKIAEKTWNGRLGILGGLSILGTTGVVHPYSCSAWIAAIQRGVDVARHNDIHHIVGCTGSMSEAAAMESFNLDYLSMIDMGDFVGGFLKYVHKNPVKQVSIAGGFAKMTKLAMGMRDLHSSRGQVDFEFYAEIFEEQNADPEICEKVRQANTALEVLGIAKSVKVNITLPIAHLAQRQAMKMLDRTGIPITVLVVSRDGKPLACFGNIPFR